MTVLKVIAKNLIGYDLLIFIIAALNGWFFYISHRRANDLYKKLRLVIFLPLQPLDGKSIKTVSHTYQLEDFVRMRERAESDYAIFTNLTAIFPLLGILGTVISLLPMVADMANLQGNFFAALTSTFWGLVFAIGFKVCDSFLSSRMEDNDKNVNLLLSRVQTEPPKEQSPEKIQ